MTVALNIEYSKELSIFLLNHYHEDFYFSIVYKKGTTLTFQS